MPKIYEPHWNTVKRYSFFMGGRGSGKSNFVAKRIIKRHNAELGRKTICIREFDTNLSDSMKPLLVDVIHSWGLTDTFRIMSNKILTPGRGWIKFKGMADHNSSGIKSFEGAVEAVVEEASELSAKSLRLLRPTILRNPGGTMTFIWNPENEMDAVDTLLRVVPEDKKERIHTTIFDNPFAQEAMFDDRKMDYEADEEMARHTWEGVYLKRSKVNVFSRIVESEIDIDNLLYRGMRDGNLRLGLDFGFAVDAMSVVLSYVDFKDRYISILSEGYKTGVEVLDMTDFIKQSLPGMEIYPVIMADSARADLISHIKNDGLRIKGVKKGPGSIRKGVQYLKGFTILIDKDATPNTYKELTEYKYKVNKRTDEIMDDPVDANNHAIDSLRYSVEDDMLKSHKLKLTDVL